MMDASYLIAAVLCGVPAFLAARAVRQFHWDSEAKQRASRIERVDGSVDRYAQSDPDADRVWPSDLPGTHRDGNSHRNGPGFYLAQYRQPGRRAVRGDHNGPRPGRHALGRDLDFANAQAVGGYDLDGD